MNLLYWGCSACLDWWWIGTGIAFGVCILGCLCCYCCSARRMARSSRGRYVPQRNSEEEYEFHATNTAPASLNRAVQATCPNPACAQLLEFPPEAMGATVACGVCGANFPLTSSN